jgi:hypothetical protein
MADILTETYDFVMPEVGASDNTWGAKLNANFLALDLLLSSFFTGGDVGVPGDVRPFKIVDPNPLLWFKESDQTAPVGYYRIGVQSDIFTLQRAVSSDFITAENILVARGGATQKSLDVSSTYQFKVTSGIAEVSGATPTLRFVETDAASPLGQWFIHGYGTGAFAIGRATVADWTTDTTYFRFTATPGNTVIVDVPMTINNAAGGNINFGNQLAANPTDLSLHMLLHSNGYGFGVTSNHLNYVSSSTATFHSFYTSTTLRFEIGANAGGVDGVMAYCGGHFALPLTYALVFGDVSNRIQRGNNGEIHFFNNDITLARIEQAGTGVGQPYSVITREKGDNRYASVSSRRYKEAVESVDEAELAAIFDNLTLRQWTWGGELAEGDERLGSAGLGLIAEEVEEVIPDAVRYQWHEEAKRVNGLDPLALIALLVAKVRQLEDRLEDI